VALTFDMEHPSRSAHDPAGPTRILDELQRTDSKASFFIQGRWARTEPLVARRVATEGHLVGCHSHFHAPLVSLTDDGIREDLEAATEAVTETTGTTPRPWFRCPFGAGHDDQRVLQVIQDCGYQNVHWNVEPQDWLEDKTPADITTSVIDGVAKLESDGVVLLHTWPRATVEALPMLITELQKHDVQLVRVDDGELQI